MTSSPPRLKKVRTKRFTNRQKYVRRCWLPGKRLSISQVARLVHRFQCFKRGLITEGNLLSTASWRMKRMREGKRTKIKTIDSATVVGHGRGRACNVDMYAVFPIWRPWPEWLTGEPRFGAYSAEDGRTLRGHARRGGRLGRDGPEGASEWLREMEREGAGRHWMRACSQSSVRQTDRRTRPQGREMNETANRPTVWKE